MTLGPDYSQPGLRPHFDNEHPTLSSGDKIPLHLRQSGIPIETVRTLLDADPSEPNYPYFFSSETGEYIHGKGKVLLATETVTRVVDYPTAENTDENGSMDVVTRDVLDYLIEDGQLTYSA